MTTEETCYYCEKHYQELQKRFNKKGFYVIKVEKRKQFDTKDGFIETCDWLEDTGCIEDATYRVTIEEKEKVNLT